MGEFTDRTGEKHITNEGYEVEIIKYVNAFDCTIRFLKYGNVINNVRFEHVKAGRIKNPYHTAVHGVGYLGEGKYRAYRASKIYKTWISMLERCYCEKSQVKHPTYIGCSVDESWHNFQNFGKWFEENYKEGHQLDKDILIKGNCVNIFLKI